MRFWKENKVLILLTMLLPLLMLFVDRPVIRWLTTEFKENYALYFIIERVEPFISIIADGFTLIGIAIILYVIGKYTSKHLETASRPLFWSLIASGVLVHVVKHLFGRGRPKHDAGFLGPTLKGGYESFPSGHATAAFCFAHVLSHYYPKYRFLFYGFAVVVGLERIEDAHHFPSDILGGAILGIVVGKWFIHKIDQSGGEAHG